MTFALAQIPQADPVPLPAPVWLLWALLMLTFVLHVLAMNTLLGGSLIAAVTRLFAGREERAHHLMLTRTITAAMPSLVALTVTLGVAALLFLQVLYGRLFFTSAILIGRWWFAVIPLLITAYYLSYLLLFREARLGRRARPVAWVVFALFAAIGLVYVVNMTLMLRTQDFVAIYRSDAAGSSLHGDATLIPRLLHVLLGAVAVAGMVVALLGVLKRRTDPSFSAWATRYGLNWFVLATAANVLTGFWWLMSLPRGALLDLTGGSIVATGVLAAGIVFGTGALVLGVLGVQSSEPRGYVRAAVATLLIAVVLMVLTRDQLRSRILADAGFDTTPWVVPQWGPIAIFLVLFVLALATVGWLVLVLLRGNVRRNSEV